MKLDKKRQLAAKVMGVGIGRIVFNEKRLDEIKDAITKQDIKDLAGDKAIMIKEKKGKRKLRKINRRREGSIKKNVNTRKRDYINLTRKLRSYLASLKKEDKVSLEDYYNLRKEIRAKNFRSKSQFKERIARMKDE